ncbi:MAG: bifunctional oligoribonuclease/PAP phosphatase NrnA [Oscillospiraceae bacterium]|nr:bifunctional oligoribonuclease/PAP phosphatase NrnA [Oscillospiraceae bacterium]
MKTLLEIADILKSKNCIYILTHQYPDGDTLGSAYALCRALQLIEKKCKVLCHDPIPSKFCFMNEYVKQEDFDPEYIISTDVADIKLLGEKLLIYSDKINMCIDHHMSNNSYADITFVDAMSAATAEIIYEIIQNMGMPIDEETASCLYVGISTDTGCFKYSNTTAKTHKIAYELINKNINLAKINSELFEKKSKEALSVEYMVYNTLEYFFRGKCAVIKLMQSMLNSAGISDNELEGIASIPRQIDGVKIGITIREKKSNLFKISVRTTEDINAIEICKIFGGGGHPRTGGCNIEGEFEEVKEKLLKTVKNKCGW